MQRCNKQFLGPSLTKENQNREKIIIIIIIKLQQKSLPKDQEQRVISHLKYIQLISTPFSWYEMLTDIHRVLLTYIRSVKAIQLNFLLEAFTLIIQRLHPEHEHEHERENESGHNTINSFSIEPSRDALEQYIREINAEITKQGFKIDRKNDELNGTLYFIFINTAMDEIIKQTTIYTHMELVAIKNLIEEIIEAEHFAFSLPRSNAQQILLSHLSRPLKELSYFIDRLIDEGWFKATLDDRLILSINSLCELKQYLLETYGNTNSSEGNRRENRSQDRDIVDGGNGPESKLLVCRQCKELVTLGFLSIEKDAFHRRCYEVYCRNNRIEANEDNLLRVGVDPSTL